MKCVVTGGTGFIGKLLVHKLATCGHHVKVLTRRSSSQKNDLKNVTFHQVDLSISEIDSEIFSDVDVIYHCAGEIADSNNMEALHVNGTERLIKAASGKVRRWVQLSSTGAYGNHRNGLVTELTDPNPQGLYEITKLKSDELVISASKLGAFDYVILRPSVVFGSQMPNRSLYSLIDMVEKRKFFFIGRRGSSANYIHVENVVHALQVCAVTEQAVGNIYNLSDYATFESFISFIANSINVDPPLLRLPATPLRVLCKLLELYDRWPLKISRIDALTSFVRFPINKIESIGYSHVVSMKDGLSDLVSSYRSNIS